MTNIEAMKLITDSYKFNITVTAERKKIIMNSKKRVLISILKENKKYTLAVMGTIMFYFWIKKLGLGITISKAAVVAAGAAAIAVAGVRVAGAVAVKHAVETKTVLEEKVSTVIGNTLPVENTPEKKVSAAVPKAQCAILLTASDDSLKLLTARLANAINAQLQAGKGSHFSKVGLSSSDDTPYSLSGSMLKLGEKYIVTVRLVDSSSSKVLANMKETINSPDEISAAAKKIGNEVALRIK